MSTAAKILTSLVALLHIGFMALEMVFWKHPIGRKIFNTTEQFANDTAFMALNQGLYNGFLAVGLIWGLSAQKRDVVTFLLICVIAAGVFGAVTVKPTIFLVQALPAIFAMIALKIRRDG